MESLNLDRLQEVQEKVLWETQQTLDQLNSFLDDYKSLKKRLKSLPDKISYNVTIPFGKMAFMPGQLVHTNEILVLLGDDWFIERSARQACEIVDRRMQHLQEKISQVESQKNLIQPRLSYTSELQDITKSGDVFEIQEPYDEEQDKIWRERHRLYLREQAQLGKEKAQSENVKLEQKLFSRLDELAKQEEENEEIQQMADVQESDSQSSKQQHRVTWEDESAVVNKRTEDSRATSNFSINTLNTGAENICDNPDDNDDDDDSYTDDDDDDDFYSDDDDDDSDDDNDNGEERVEENNISTSVNVIRFTHTPSTDVKAVSSLGSINTPADIYLKYRPPPKSILINKDLKCNKVKSKSVKYASAVSSTKSSSAIKNVSNFRSTASGKNSVNSEGESQKNKSALQASDEVPAVRSNVVERVQPSELSAALPVVNGNIMSGSTRYEQETVAKNSCDTAQAPPAPRISKFKASRMKQN